MKIKIKITEEEFVEHVDWMVKNSISDNKMILEWYKIRQMLLDVRHRLKIEKNFKFHH